MVAAARKYERIVQVGTQARSSDAEQQAADYIHSGRLGKILHAKAIVYRRREGIGKVDGPRPIPRSVDYNLWLGPAPEAPVRRTVFHYDWHWIWSTGNGEIGNNGVHYLDRCRWLLGRPGLPHRAISLGGRFLFDDDGQTPNSQLALLDYDPAPILCEVRNLAEQPGSKKMDRYRSLTTGILVQCEGGYYVNGSGRAAIFDNEDKQIVAFTDRQPVAEQGSAHQANFFSAMRSRQPGDLNAEVREGHISTALCHMANVSYRLGSAAASRGAWTAAAAEGEWSDACERFHSHLSAHRIDIRQTPVTLGPWVTVDQDTESFAGQGAEQANSLSRRDYREGFVVPELA
jgi:predicted dehydrogenase